jgi:hypothetical protein
MLPQTCLLSVSLQFGLGFCKATVLPNDSSMMICGPKGTKGTERALWEAPLQAHAELVLFERVFAIVIDGHAPSW